MVYMTDKRQIIRRRFALFIVVGASVALALLVVASAAGAEATDGLIPAPPTATDDAAPIEEVAATVAGTLPVEQAEVPATSAEAEPIEKSEATSPTASARTAVASVTNRPPVSVSTSPAGAAGRPVAAIAASVSDRTDSLAAAETSVEATIAPVANHVQALAESASRDSSERITSISRGAAAALSPLTERLAVGAADTSLLPLLSPTVPATDETLLPPPGPFQSGGEAPGDGLLPELQSGFFAARSPIASSELTGDYPTLPAVGEMKAAGAALTRLEPRETLPTATGGTRPGSSGGTTRDPGGSAPPDAPPAPGAVAPGIGDSSFVPFAALLALLALVAPVSTRRRREAADLRPTTLFVCALERPG
jgi:hypothetical protein